MPDRVYKNKVRLIHVVYISVNDETNIPVWTTGVKIHGVNKLRTLPIHLWSDGVMTWQDRRQDLEEDF